MRRAEYNSTDRVNFPRPRQLFSHNDQQSIWQSSSPEGSKIGWGGNIGDLAIANSLHTNALFACMSVTGNAVFLSGDTALQYQLSIGDTRDSTGNYAPADQWHVGQGRLLPSTSVDQYAATLARWFGVADAELASVLPNLGNFGGPSYPVNLGFMG